MRTTVGLVATGILIAFCCALHTVQVVAQQAGEREYKAHVVLVGDSTVTDRTGWGVGFAACLADGVTCTNLARGGRSSSSFREEGLWDEALELKPDWMLVQFGHNDQPGHPGRENEADKGYRANMERYVDEARAAGIRPVLVTPLSRREWGKTKRDQGRIVSSLEPYVEVVKAIAAEKRVPLIDLHWRSTEVYQSLGQKGCEMISPTKEDGQWDRTHLNRSGAVMFGSMVAMDCRSFVPGLASHFRTSKLAELQRANKTPSMGKPTDRAIRRVADAPIAKGKCAFTVARDESGDFRTLQEAIDAVPDNNADRTIIRLKHGLYMGQVIIPASKPNITLLGEDRTTTIVSYALTVHDSVPPEVPEEFAGYGVVVLAEGFRAANLAFRQVAGDHGQAIALRLDGDRAILRDCNLLGWQDTVRLERGRHYLRDCHVEGRVDYIYGGATAVLEKCTLHTKNEGYITAASTPQEQRWGYVFINCNLTGTGPNQVYLGRPWRPYASVAYLNCKMDGSIVRAGWHNWGKSENEKTVRFAEYGSTGRGANAESRVSWSRRMTDEEAETISAESVLQGDDGWDAAAEYAQTLQ